MATLGEIVYMIQDELKNVSDDAFFVEEHIIYLINNYRTFILKQRYSDIKKPIPPANYQTICLDLKEVDAIDGTPCTGCSYLRSTVKIPFLMSIANPRVYPLDYFQGDISYISRDRFKYVGHNRYLQNILYTTLGPDNYLYMKSKNPQFRYLEKIKLTGVFYDFKDALQYQCVAEGEEACEILETTFPLEESLIPNLNQLVVAELLGSLYRPKDEQNDSNDSLSGIQTNQN